MMKYVNPEYVSILVESEDVITASIWSVVIPNKPGEEKNYVQTKDYHVNTETGEVEKVSTTIMAGLDALGLGI